MDEVKLEVEKNEERLKALYDPIRIRITSCLKEPRTPKQVSEMINVRANNLYHHFRVLEKAGIIELIESRNGKGFIKEDYYCLKEPDGIAGLIGIPDKHRQQFLFSLFQALTDDYKSSVIRYESTVAFGSRDDLQFRESDLEEVRQVIMKHRDELKKELEQLSEPGTPPGYQLSIFGFRV